MAHVARSSAASVAALESQGSSQDDSTFDAKHVPPTRRRRWLKRTAYALAALVALTIVAWLAIPPIARWQLETRLTEALQRRTTVGSVSFNPLSLKLTLRDFAIADRQGTTPLLAFDEVVADASAASLWHRGPVLDALKLTSPRVFLARYADGRLNIQDLVDRALAPSTEPDAPPRRFSLNNVEIVDGAIAIDDAVTARKHAITSLAIGIPFLSSLPYETTIHVTPHVAGTFNGARFALEGSTTPFAERRESSLAIDLDALALRPYVAYLPVKPRIELADGTLTTRLKLAFVDGEIGERKLELRGDARLDGLALHRRDASALASAKSISVAIDRMDLLTGDATIASVGVIAPTIEVKRLADGTIEWAQPLFEGQGAAPAATGEPARKPAVTVANVSIEQGALSLSDETSGFRSALADVTIGATNVSTVPGQRAHAKVAFVSSDRIASFSGEADVDPSTRAAEGRFELAKFSLGLLFPYYKSALAVDVQSGSLDVASAFAVDASGNVRLTSGKATISELKTAFPGSREPLWQVPRLTAEGIDVDVAAHKVVMEALTSERASLRVVREADGTLAMARIVRAPPPSTQPASTDDAAWSVLAKKVALGRVSIDVEDRVPQPAVKLAVRDLELTATDVTSAPGTRSRVTLRTRIGDRGRVAFAGNIARTPMRIDGDLEASGLALVPVKAYVEPHINVLFTGGTVAAKGRVSVDASKADTVDGAWKGNVTVTDFAALDKPTTSDLVRWKSLALEGMDIGTAPMRATIARIGVNDFYARTIVYPDGTLNLARLVTPGAAPEPPADAKPAPAAATPASDKSLPITLGRIEFDGGNVNFSDLFVKPNYSANLTEVKGSVTTMSETQAGDVAIVARVDHSAPVDVQGRIHPFAKELALDVTAKARDIDLPPLTPYSVKYAGYGISKGKLTFEVHYQVEKRKLAAQNHLVLDQLTFGERVESPTATKLPVLLAVALLKDTRGVIDIELPIEGSLDDPQFSVGGLIVRVIVNLLTKAATAPFALLAHAFGGGDELSTVAFAPGSAAIADDAQKRIDTLAKALADRPGLKLQIGGNADPAADGEALRRASVDTALKRAKLKTLAKDGTAPASVEEVTIAADERNRWLTEAYRDAPLPDRPRDVLGRLKEVPAAEMEAALYAKTTLDEDGLRLLANNRAQAVKDAIAQKGVAGERLFVLAPKVGAGASKDGPVGDSAASEPRKTEAARSTTRVDLTLG